MAEFLRNSDAFIWSIESDPRLRSTIVTLIFLDRSPDWNELVNRFERLSRTVPMFRQRVVHLRRVTAAAPGSIDTLLEMARRLRSRVERGYRGDTRL